MLKFCTLASSSSGNSVFMQDGDDAVLIDCGLSCKMTLAAMCESGLDPRMIRAILITHEHSDHVKGVRVLQKKLGVPVMGAYGTLRALSDQLSEVPPHQVIPVEDSFYLGGLEVQPFPLSHDAAQPMGYRIFGHTGSCAVCTDTGVLLKEAEAALSGCDCVLLEANHDPELLQGCEAYPAATRKRIAGRHGHLSNEQSAQAAAMLYRSGTRAVLLGHLSPHTNTPALAYAAVRDGLMQAGADIGRDVKLLVAPQFGVSPMLVRS